MEEIRRENPDRMYLNKAKQFEKLIDELMKEQPDESLVKNMMEDVGLPYGQDSIERLNTVLKALHS